MQGAQRNEPKTRTCINNGKLGSSENNWLFKLQWKETFTLFRHGLFPQQNTDIKWCKEENMIWKLYWKQHHCNVNNKIVYTKRAHGRQPYHISEQRKPKKLRKQWPCIETTLMQETYQTPPCQTLSLLYRHISTLSVEEERGRTPRNKVKPLNETNSHQVQEPDRNWTPPTPQDPSYL